MSKGFDITKVKEEIDRKKQAKADRSVILGENVKAPLSPDKFLSELVHSRNSGQKTGASVKVAAVARVADAKVKGKNVDVGAVTQELLQHAKPKTQHQNVAKVPNNMGNIDESKAQEKARIAELARQMENNERDNPVRNSTLGDALSQYQNTPHVGSPMSNSGYLTEQQMIQQRGMQPQNNNSNMIVEQLHNVAQEFLNENFGSLFSQALKQTIVETYKADRVKEAINENRDLIKDIVVETILELQKRGQNSKK